METTKTETRQTARQRFKRALAMLGKVRPFIRGIVSNCKPTLVRGEDKKKIPTMAVMIRPNRRFKMYCNPEFISEQRRTEHVAGVINHEINHMMREHLTLDRTGLDVEVLNLTLEVHANMDIPRAWLPPQTEEGDALTHEHFNISKEIRDWKEIYAILIKKFKKKSQRNEAQQGKMNDTGIKKVMAGKGTGHSNKPKTKGKMSKSLKKRLTDSQEIKSMLASILNKVWKKRVEKQELDADESDDAKPIVYEELKLMQECVDHIPGLHPGMLKLLRVKTDTNIKWEQYLQNFVCSLRKRASSYRRMNKRFPDLLGIVPGRDTKVGKSNIVAFIDTSGSCASWASRFLNEVEKLDRYCNGLIVEWDTCEEAAYRIKETPQRNSVMGGGGTNFDGCLNNEYLTKLARRFNMRRFDGIVFLTDLIVRLPTKAPNTPVMWFVINKRKTAHFGKIIRLEK